MKLYPASSVLIPPGEEIEGPVNSHCLLVAKIYGVSVLIPLVVFRDHSNHGWAGDFAGYLVFHGDWLPPDFCHDFRDDECYLRSDGRDYGLLISLRPFHVYFPRIWYCVHRTQSRLRNVSPWKSIVYHSPYLCPPYLS